MRYTPHTPETITYLEKQRASSDKKLKKGGAKHDEEQNLILTKKQKRFIKDYDAPINEESRIKMMTSWDVEDYIKELEKNSEDLSEHRLSQLIRDYIYREIMSGHTQYLYPERVGDIKKFIKKFTDKFYIPTKKAVSNLIMDEMSREPSLEDWEQKKEFFGIEFSEAEIKKMRIRSISFEIVFESPYMGMEIYRALTKRNPDIAKLDEEILRDALFLLRGQAAKTKQGGDRVYYQERLKKAEKAQTVEELSSILRNKG